MSVIRSLLNKLEEKRSDDLNPRRNRQLHEEIQQHLQGIPDENRSAFDHLLGEYLSGRMRERLIAIGLNRIVITVSRHDFPCSIDIEGIWNRYYINLQIEPDSFSLAFYESGPDEYEDYPLTSPDQPYEKLKKLIKELS